MRELQSDDRKKSEKQTAPEDVSSPPFLPQDSATSALIPGRLTLTQLGGPSTTWIHIT